jgi:hypothetical protein
MDLDRTFSDTLVTVRIRACRPPERSGYSLGRVPLRSVRVVAVLFAAAAVLAVLADTVFTALDRPWFGSATVLWFGAAAGTMLVLLCLLVAAYTELLARFDRQQAQLDQLRSSFDTHADDVFTLVQGSLEADYWRAPEEDVGAGSNIRPLLPRPRP